MKTFDEIKDSIKTNNIILINSAQSEIDAHNGSRKYLRPFELKSAEMIVRDRNLYNENLDEVTAITIGSYTNSLISAIQRAYALHLVEYWQNTERFFDDYIVGLDQNGNLKQGAFFAKDICYFLGISVKDLAPCFKDQKQVPLNPNVPNFGDKFRMLVNENFGTKIPMAGVLEQALNDYETVAFKDDQVAKDLALVKLREAQRDSGILKNGSDYRLLSQDENYIAAKDRISGRKL